MVREAVESANNSGANQDSAVPMGNQSLYKIKDLCRIFSISKPTVYEWIKAGKLKPRRIKGRVFFLEKDIRSLLEDC